MLLTSFGRVCRVASQQALVGAGSGPLALASGSTVQLRRSSFQPPNDVTEEVPVPTDERYAEFVFDAAEQAFDVEATKLEWGRRKSFLSWSLDPKLSLIKAVIDPMFTFVTPTGSERIYRFECVGAGLVAEAAVRVQAMWLRNLPVVRMANREPVQIVGGFDLVAFGTHFTYLRLATDEQDGEDGSVFMWGVNLGLSFGATIMNGGYLMPCTRHIPVTIKDATDTLEKLNKQRQSA